jgi:hypothetical protein
VADLMTREGRCQHCRRWVTVAFGGEPTDNTEGASKMGTETICAKCDACGKTMTSGAGCTYKTEGRLPYGKEQWPEDLPAEEKEPYCGDCGVALGQYHHPGCDAEECPICGGQRLGMECCSCGEEDDEA